MSDVLKQLKALKMALRTGKVSTVPDPVFLADCIERFEAEPEKGLDRAFGLVRGRGQRSRLTIEAADQRWQKLQTLRAEFYAGEPKTRAASQIEHDAREHLARHYIPPTVPKHRRAEYAELIGSAAKPNGSVYTARELVKHLNEGSNGNSVQKRVA